MTAVPTTECTIRVMGSDEDIVRCFTVMQQLRQNLKAEEFLARVRRQGLDGYVLIAREQGARIVAVAGFRQRESLFLGRFLYIEDLVTERDQRSQGHGRAMLQWLIGEARRRDCGHVELDSGLQRADAHRFYLREGLYVRSHHFTMPLK
jgi:GNAT superfamily N-acetyltransferase